MSPPPQDADNNFKLRPRANTNSFPTFGWRKGKQDSHSLEPALPSQPLDLEALIEALTPPAVPSLGHARSLASALLNRVVLPRPAVLNPILASLCDVESPLPLQSAGYEILAAYWENSDGVIVGTADRLSYFSLFLGPATPWATDLWEPRFKALRALSKWGSEIIGIETPFINVLKSWIQGCFDGLVGGELIERGERAERERSIDVLATFLTSTVETPQIVARIPEEELASILQFYAGLIDQSLDSPINHAVFDPSTSSSPTTETHSSSTSTTSRSSQTHRRKPSSISSVSLPTPAGTSHVVTSPTKRPADISVTLYLSHLSSQLKIISPTYLNNILPVLFRTVAFYSSPLPRLSVVARSPRLASMEDKITNMLNTLLAGPYSSLCIQILKRHLFPPHPQNNMDLSIQISLGAQRTLRNYIRRGLCTRLARAYISRESSVGYAPSGAPGHMDVERDLMERAWPKDEVSGWDAGKLGRVLARSVETWVILSLDVDSNERRAFIEQILDEVAGTLKDVFQELDSREEMNATLDEEEACAVGETLFQLASYLLPLKNHDGTPFIVPLSQPTDAPTPYLRTLSSILARDHSTYLNPLLSTTLLYIADHLADADTAKLAGAMHEQHDLSPTSPQWLNNWQNLLSNFTVISQLRPLTRKAVMIYIESVYASVKDMPSYRIPLADLVFKFCQRQLLELDIYDDNIDAIWRILGDEVVLRTVEAQGSTDLTIEKYLDLIVNIASEADDEDDDTASVITAETAPLPQTSFSSGPSMAVPPIPPRMQSEYQGPGKDKDSTIPSVMSLLSSLTTASSSRSPSSQPREDQPYPTPSACKSEISFPRVVGAVVSLIVIFSEMAFTPHSLSDTNINLAARIYGILVTLLERGKSTRTRMTILQFLMRLRVDRDHRIYYVDAGYDPDGHVLLLASLIHRVWDDGLPPQTSQDDDPTDSFEIRKTRARMPQERDGRGSSRGRGGRPSTSGASRSRSRATTQPMPQTVPAKHRGNIWHIPELLPFSVSGIGTPSETLISYDHQSPGHRLVLPISTYLSAIAGILEKECNWEILSYVLCHLPVQLANKHLFCGPKSREWTAKILTILCTGIISGELGVYVDYWPPGLKLRDAQGLAYHTLSVLISYHRAFDVKSRHLLVEVFQAGLNGQPSTIKCCLHALSLSAFELQSSVTRSLSRILESLSQIMSNPDIAVHILGFLSIVGSLGALHANFTEADYKMVFGVALQYLQHHNRTGVVTTSSWALSEHVRILSYCVLYVWFLAVRLPDRPRHVSYIIRQLLLANKSNEEVDEPTEVCFDWLARYTYASADPRPANSLLGDIVMNSSVRGSPEIALGEKTWLLGNSVVSIRTLARLGWIEVIIRRPSGFTKFLCRAENVPMVSSGDVDPDILSIPASLLMERDRGSKETTSAEESKAAQTTSETVQTGNVLSVLRPNNEISNDSLSSPDPITGYVWSGAAPSQRRKEVAIDPSYFALQLSSYPDLITSPSLRVLVDPSLLPNFFRTLDRMPVIDTHKVGIMYVAPGQTQEREILHNTHGSPAYGRFLEGIGRLINLRGQVDVYAGGLDPDQDGEYAYAWWDDIGQILYHTATMMPTHLNDPQCNNKKRHIGNDYVRIIWNDSGMPYRFDTLTTQFQFVNIVIEPHSLGAIAAFSNNLHENEYFKVTVQRAPGMAEFAPVGNFKLISAENLPFLVRQLSLLADWFASIFERTRNDTERVETQTNWHSRLQAIKRFRKQVPVPEIVQPVDGIVGQEAFRDFTTVF